MHIWKFEDEQTTPCIFGLICIDQAVHISKQDLPITLAAVPPPSRQISTHSHTRIKKHRPAPPKLDNLAGQSDTPESNITDQSRAKFLRSSSSPSRSVHLRPIRKNHRHRHAVYLRGEYDVQMSHGKIHQIFHILWDIPGHVPWDT